MCLHCWKFSHKGGYFPIILGPGDVNDASQNNHNEYLIGKCWTNSNNLMVDSIYSFWMHNNIWGWFQHPVILKNAGYMTMKFAYLWDSLQNVKNWKKHRKWNSEHGYQDNQNISIFCCLFQKPDRILLPKITKYLEINLLSIAAQMMVTWQFLRAYGIVLGLLKDA